MGKLLSTQKWRDPGPKDWTKEKVDELKETIQALREEDRKAHILLCGPTNAGKSALMNSLFSIRDGRPVFISATGSTKMDGKTLTKRCIRSNLSDIFNNCCITDTTGILEHTSKGLNIEDIIALVEGHIKEGYTFQDNEPIDERSPFYSRTPTEEDKVHCLVLVIDVTTLKSFHPTRTTTTYKNSTEQTPDQYLLKIRAITNAMNSKCIPIVLLLTKIDLLDEHVGANIKKMHGRATVEKAVKEAREIFGVDECNIFPIINFVKSIEFKPLASIPHLLAMRHILGFARDCPRAIGINRADAHS